MTTPNDHLPALIKRGIAQWLDARLQPSGSRVRVPRRSGLQTEVERSVLAMELVHGLLDTPAEVGDSDNNS